MSLGYKYPRTRDLGFILFQTIGALPFSFSLKSARGSPSSTTKTQISTLHRILLTPEHPILAGSSSICAGKGSRYSFKIDEDMTLMHTTIIGARNGVEEVQQGFPSQQGGPRLIRFESPRWRPKAIQVRVQFGVHEQCAIKRTPRSHTESVLDVLYMVGSKIS
jgi:hypothetical protein